MTREGTAQDWLERIADGRPLPEDYEGSQVRALVGFGWVERQGDKLVLTASGAELASNPPEGEAG